MFSIDGRPCRSDLAPPALVPESAAGGTCHARIVVASLPLARHVTSPPVVLAPMAGITNIAFRRLCREQGAGLFVCEMITTRALVERNPKTLRMVAFADGEQP